MKKDFSVDDFVTVNVGETRVKIQVHYEKNGTRVRLVIGNIRSWWEYFAHPSQCDAMKEEK